MTTKSFAKIIAVLVVSSVVLVLSRHIYLLRFPVLVDYTSEAALEEAIFKANKCDTAAMNLSCQEILVAWLLQSLLRMGCKKFCRRK